LSTKEAGGGGALINLGDLSRPATVLIEKISDAVGGIAKPWQMVRVARAEAQVKAIRAQSRIRISDIEERALIRMVHEEGKKQANIENITAKAIPHLTADARPEDVENDWIAHFFDRCRLISDDEMQSLWAKILSGQVNSPGSFSKRTINLAATLDKSDAELFTRFCTFVWTSSGSGGEFPLIYQINNALITEYGLTFETLTHLENIGLVNFNHSAGFSLPGLPQLFSLKYYDIDVNIEFPRENNNILGLGIAVLTRAGVQLAHISGGVKSDTYFMSMLEGWMNIGYILSSPLRSQFVELGSV
jgi:hypothetical protein